MNKTLRVKLNKKSYFQGGGGVNLPTPKKRKYKADPAILVMPRFKEPLFRNYDYTEQPGVNGKAKHGPGTGAYSGKYKSIKEFRKAKKKNLKKYKAEELWQHDDGSITKSRKDKIKRRANLIQLMIKYAIDLPYDESPTGPILGDSYNRDYIGGLTDEYLGPVDEAGRKEDALNYGQQKDIPESEALPARELNKEKIEELLSKYLNLIPKETDLFGMPGGVESPELDADKMKQDSQYFGNTDPPNDEKKIPWL